MFSVFGKLEQRLPEAIFIRECAGIFQSFFSPAAAFNGAYHEILRRMFKVYEFYHIHSVAHILEHRGTDGICQKRGHTLLYYAVRHEDVKLAAFPDGTVDLMLAAWHGENVLRFLFQRVPDRIVGCRIAGLIITLLSASVSTGWLNTALLSFGNPASRSAQSLETVFSIAVPSLAEQLFQPQRCGLEFIFAV